MVAAVGAAAAIGGSLISANATRKAAGGQEAASREANELQRYMYDRNVELAMPTINAGNMARDSLLYRLGLSPARGASGGARQYTEAELREQLTPQFTTQSLNTSIGGGGVPITITPDDPRWDWTKGFDQEAGAGGQRTQVYMQPVSSQTSTVNTEALNAEVQRRLAEQQAAQQAAASDPSFGDLAQKFEFEKYTPGTFSYTGEDLYKDPSYQWRLDQGQKALDRSGAAAGRFLSGRQLQAASDYNQGAASQEFQSAYNRALGTFGTNEGNRKNAFDTNESNRFNAYQANFTNAINPLLSLSGSGQVGAQFLGSAGQNSANQISNNLMGAANASGAGQIAGANAISSGVNNAVSGYQQNQLLNQLMNRNTGVNNNPGGITGTGGQSGISAYGAYGGMPSYLG